MPPQGYAPAPKSVNFGALWNDNTKRPLFYMFGIAFTVLIAMFFNYVAIDLWFDTYGISGYRIIGFMDEAGAISILVLFSLIISIGIMVFAALDLFKAGMNKRLLKLVFMISSLAYATISLIILTAIASTSDFTVGFGAILNFLLGGGMVFVYFFFLNKIYANKPVSPQNIYNQPMGM
ncbi:MAG: hypothetical protein Q4A83_03520, partial [Bacillota bacterium]|nr:hypothetical protein [Bacillota bacterium]